MFLPIVAGIRTGDDGVTLDTSDERIGFRGWAKISQVVHGGDPEILLVAGGAQWTGVYAERVGVHVIVDAKPLGEALVADPALQNFVRTDAPGVVHACHLRPRRSEGIPHVRAGGEGSHRLRDTCSGRGALQAVSEKIFDGHAMA